MHRKRLWSASLQKFVAVKVQARVLRTIDKVGGLDEYLLGNKPARIRELGVEGWRLRWEVMGRGKRGQGLAGGERKAGRKTEGGKKNGERVVGGDEHAFSVGEEVARAGHREDGPGIRTVEGHVEGSAEESSLVELDAGRFEDEMEDLKRPATAKESDGEREGILSKLRGLFSRRREER